jgi:tetratricopeptide (TPR) repeat protein
MARFDKLEFNPRRQPAPEPEEPKAAVTDAGHWMSEADRFRRVGLYEGALRYYSRALELDRSLVAGWIGQVQMLVQLDEHPEAELWSRKGLELFPNNGELMAGRAQAFCRMKARKQSHALCDGSLQQPGQSAYRWLVRGEIMVADGQDKDGYCFDKAQGIDADWLVPLEIALVYLYYGNPTKALPRARKALESATDSYFAWYVQGLCQSQLGLVKPARDSFGHCLELCPKHEDAQQQLNRLGGWRSLVRRVLHPFAGG